MIWPIVKNVEYYTDRVIFDTWITKDIHASVIFEKHFDRNFWSNNLPECELVSWIIFALHDTELDLLSGCYKSIWCNCEFEIEALFDEV